MTKKTILIVDDSAVIRGVISRIIQAGEDMKVIGTATNGAMAVDLYAQHKPDIVILDIEMPIMNGMEALEKIIAMDATAKVIMCSTLSQKNAEISLKALSIGAIDYIPKPSNSSEVENADHFKSTLMRMIQAIPKRLETQAETDGTNAERPQTEAPILSNLNDLSEKTEHGATVKAETKTISSIPKIFEGAFNLKPKPLASWSPQILAIGSSTGGPQALFTLLRDLKDLSVPIVITQHMPATFTSILAKHISTQTGILCLEGEDDMYLEAGKAYVAPGGKHMLFKKNDDGRVKIKLNDGPMENFCKPAVDPMLRSLIEIYQGRILCAIMTGMGHDGLQGCKELIAKGGHVYAQDAASSIVWGMPGSVAKANLCSDVLPLDQMGLKLKQIAK